MYLNIFHININITQIVTSLILIIILGYLSSCEPGNSRKFNAENSDPKAVEIADQVIEAMGGYKSWDNTRHISWNFFESRKHFWDKKTGDVRIESLKDDLIILMNINSEKGEVYKDGKIMENSDSITNYLDQGKNFWINDSYWLIMPFKLKDPGVTLKYIGEEDVNGKKADVIQITFEDVGATPENKYHVYVDQEDKLVTQWAFFRQANQEQPDFMSPWQDYNKYGEILISGNRGESSLSNISVHNSLPKKVYNSFEPVSL
ncbi:MAG: hypothetical protein M3421_06035 [Bacteroidota bacterium]|nr:hypothetical protein [Bacteroidota bacterium]